jgi:hypothetical protein
MHIINHHPHAPHNHTHILHTARVQERMRVCAYLVDRL